MAVDLDKIFGAAGSVTIPRPKVRHTPELERVRRLPRWTTAPNLAPQLTELLRTPGGTWQLKPIQAQALALLAEHGGLMASIGVGGGKTLISFLAPTVVGARCPVLVLPAKLRDRKTPRDFAALAHHWRAPTGGLAPPGSPAAIRLISYEQIGRSGDNDLLADCDLLILDECHKIKNKSASVTRKILRWCGEHQDVPVLAMSGTITSRSLRDFAHVLAICCESAMIPLPRDARELDLWAAATDAKVSDRADPGALRVFLQPGESPSLEAVRRAVGDRIFSAPGCLRSTSGDVDASILITADDPRELPPETAPFFEAMDCGDAPDGDLLLPADRYRHTRTLVLGFYNMFDPPPPIEWLEARRDWHRLVREVLEAEIPGADSPLEVANKIDQGGMAGAGTLARWREIKDTYAPVSVPEWVTLDPLHDIARKAEGIVWVEHVPVGEKLSEITGWKYYRQKGLAPDGSFIDDADPANGPIIASIAANAEGRNLQHWHCNYIVTPPANGGTWEQLLGRTHRLGQQADTVEVVVRLGHPDLRAAVEQAVEDARRDQAITRQPKKILLADLDI